MKAYPSSGRPAWNQSEWINLAKLEKRLRERFRPTWLRFLSDPDPFYLGHSPNKLIANTGRWLTAEIKLEPNSGWTDEERAELVERHNKRQAEEAEAEAEIRRDKHREKTRQAMLQSEKVDPALTRRMVEQLKRGLKR